MKSKKFLSNSIYHKEIMFRVKYDKTKKIWSSDDASEVINSNISLGQILLKSMDSFGTKLSQVICRHRI